MPLETTPSHYLSLTPRTNTSIWPLVSIYDISSLLASFQLYLFVNIHSCELGLAHNSNTHPHTRAHIQDSWTAAHTTNCTSTTQSTMWASSITSTLLAANLQTSLIFLHLNLQDQNVLTQLIAMIWTLSCQMRTWTRRLLKEVTSTQLLFPFFRVTNSDY